MPPARTDTKTGKHDVGSAVPASARGTYPPGFEGNLRAFRARVWPFAYCATERDGFRVAAFVDGVRRAVEDGPAPAAVVGTRGGCDRGGHAILGGA